VDLDSLSRSWAQALAKAPLILPDAHKAFATVEEDAKKIANIVLSATARDLDERLTYMNYAMETLAGRLAKLRRIMNEPAEDLSHIGVIADDPLSEDEDEDEYGGEDVEEELMVDLLVADLLHERNADDIIGDEDID
jgi:hypothetical protein